MRKPTILLMAAQAALRCRVQALLRAEGFDVLQAVDTDGGWRIIQQRRPDLILLGQAQRDAGEVLEMGRQVRRWHRRLPLILLTADSSEELAIAALKIGIDDYLKEPWSSEELTASVRRCLADVPPYAPSPHHDVQACSRHHARPLIGNGPAMQQIKDYIGRIADTDSTILITGESGTGKELVAEMIHRTSRRHAKPFVGINCAAIPDSLLESELFGYEKGAFTGANTLKEGQFQFAEGGTIFLDEIGDMSPYAQAKILRAIDSRTIYRLGGRRSIPIDVRIIAATNQELEQLVSTQRFRPDLYFRVNVGRIHLPPLRQRPEDLPDLFAYYIRALNRQFGLDVEGLSDEAMAYLQRYQWPGNVREVKNLLEAIFINFMSSPPRRITFNDLPELFRQRSAEVAQLPQGERDRVLSALLRTDWNVSKAAQQLCWSRMTVYRKMRKYQINSPLTRPSAAATLESSLDDARGC